MDVLKFLVGVSVAIIIAMGVAIGFIMMVNRYLGLVGGCP